jgi:MtN3 and saliva related transmembrane protein
MITELIGWAAAVILLLTIGRQVYTQWRDRTSAGVSHWLFIGQLAASVGFVTYSWLEGDPVFVATNAAMLVTAVVGQVIYLRNRERGAAEAAPTAKNPYSARG